MSNEITQKIIDALKNSTGKITMFADGFVDEVWEIVSSRTDLETFELYTQMTQFSQRISDSGTGGVGIEIIRKRRAFGGFAANIGYASARLGVDTTLVGIYGKGKLDPVFEEISGLCRVLTLGEPAVTHVFEFDDGKILLSDMKPLQNVSWKQIVDTVGLKELVSMLTQSDIIGVGYWSLLPAFDEIVSEICANLPGDSKPRRFFFDFADFRKKSNASLIDTLQKLRVLNEKFPMTLSINEHEAAALFAIYNQTFDDQGCSISEKTEHVRTQIALDELVIHTPHYAIAATSKNEPVYSASVFCEKPARSAGAGDTFNGGYIAASLAGLDIAERLRVANSAVGYFLRSGDFPGIQNLTDSL